MNIYHMYKKIGSQGGLQNYNVSFYSTHAEEGAKKILKGDKIESGVLYAIIHNEQNSSIGELMQIMFNELKATETREICNNNRWLGEIFRCYLKKAV